jgi:hypothetical protein
MGGLFYELVIAFLTSSFFVLEIGIVLLSNRIKYPPSCFDMLLINFLFNKWD